MHPADASHPRNTLPPWGSPKSNSSSQRLLPPISLIDPGLGRRQFPTCRPASDNTRGMAPELALRAPPCTPPTTLGCRKASVVFDRPEEVEDNTGAAVPPVKKKRRRQALSCTECKRRKIKCDRAHPCSQCSRRGEQSRCQWHIIEPIEKCVTRAEHEELKTRVVELSEEVQRLQRLVNSTKADGPAIQGATAEAVPAPSASGLVANPTLIPRAENKCPNSSQALGHRRHEEPQVQPHRHRTPVLVLTSPTSRSPPLSSRPPSPQERSDRPAIIAKTSRHSLAALVTDPPNTMQAKKQRTLLSTNDHLRHRSRPPPVLAGQVAH